MPLSQKTKIIWLVNVLVVLGSISVNIYLPSLPHLEEVFHTSPELLKLSITLFLLGYGVSQFFWGSLSERFGRKKPIFIGLTLSCIGSTLAMLAFNVTMLDIARFIEGFGIGCALVMGRAILTDSFDRIELSKAASFMLISNSIIPALAPLLGGFFLTWFSWRVIFLFLIFYSLGLMFLYYKGIPETHKKIKTSFSFIHAIREYLYALSHRKFLSYFALNALAGAGLMAYYASTPFIFIIGLHIPAQTYSFLSFPIVGTYILGSLLCNRITHRIGVNHTILLGILLGILSSILFACFWIFSSLSIVTVVLPTMIFSLAVGIISPNTNAVALSALGHMAGSSAAILGAGAAVAGALFTYILTRSNLQSLGSLTIFTGGLFFFILLIYLSTKKVRSGGISSTQKF